ncbi:hypothetical protein KY320_01140 [Candidatus Woesearchaeota archaeon]|nr:hypothetical protein [Candidatus Woesearchaeota archaeon]
MKEAEILDWAYEYLKNRDLVFRRIEDIKLEPHRLLVKYKDEHIEVVVAMTDLSELKLEKLDTEMSVFVPNKRQNLDFLIKRWSEFAALPNLKFVFFNPGSLLEKRWIIKPYVHNKICDSQSLKQGLVAMFEGVDALS